MYGTLSNALEKSKKIQSVWLFLFKQLAKSCVIVISWVLHDLPAWKPSWSSHRIL